MDSDNYYDDFIKEAKVILEKYKKRCNPKNKNLLLINEDCDDTFYFDYGDDSFHMYGVYECDNSGIWSRKCVPSYCDNGYYFDKTKMKCIEDICLKVQLKTKTYLVLFIVFLVLFLIFLIIFLICCCTGGFF